MVAPPGVCSRASFSLTSVGQVIIAARAGIDELQVDVLTDSFEIAITPILVRIGGGGAAALLLRTIVGAAGGMRLDLVGGAPHDVNAAAIGLPAWNAGSEMLVGISDAAIVLFLVLVFRSVGSGIATQPELLDELVALLVVGKLLESRLLLPA